MLGARTGTAEPTANLAALRHPFGLLCLTLGYLGFHVEPLAAHFVDAGLAPHLVNDRRCVVKTKITR